MGGCCHGRTFVTLMAAPGQDLSEQICSHEKITDQQRKRNRHIISLIGCIKAWKKRCYGQTG